MVTALKVSATPSLSSACKAGAAIAASVNTKDSMVAMSGAIMPAPLAMPLMVTLVLPILAVAVATFGKGVGGHDRLRGGEEAAGSGAADQAVHHGGEFGGVERFADHAGGGEEDLGRLAAGRLGGDVGGELGSRPPALAGEGIGIAGIDHQRARFVADFRCARHHSTGADGHFDLVNTPATVVPGANSASSTSVRPA